MHQLHRTGGRYPASCWHAGCLARRRHDLHVGLGALGPPGVVLKPSSRLLRVVGLLVPPRPPCSRSSRAFCRGGKGEVNPSWVCLVPGRPDLQELLHVVLFWGLVTAALCGLWASPPVLVRPHAHALCLAFCWSLLLIFAWGPLGDPLLRRASFHQGTVIVASSWSCPVGPA